jgi:hypothetical protein
MFWWADHYGILNFKTTLNKEGFDAIPLENLCDFQDL